MIDDALEADRWVCWVLGKRPNETMIAAARRVLDAANAGIEQPEGACEAAVIIDGPGESWQRIYRAADVAKRVARTNPLRTTDATKVDP